MQSPIQSASSPVPTTGARSKQSCRSEDLAYQAVTIASILLVLVSAWVF